jgi:hypothetical protein
LPAWPKLANSRIESSSISLARLSVRFLLKRAPVKALRHKHSPRSLVAIGGVASVPLESEQSLDPEREFRAGLLRGLNAGVSSIWHTAAREVRVQLISAKGRLVLSLFGLLGLLPSLLRTQIAASSGVGVSTDQVLQNQQLV